MTRQTAQGAGADPLIGAIAGGYRIHSLLSVGGMGSVYRAEHQMIGRPAAIKVLLPEMSTDRAMVQRFFTEAKATTAIQHPGIVEVFDFGYLPSGQAFIVMELLDGQTLAQRTHGTRLPESEAAALLVSAAEALAAAHAAGVVHRDLKPDNIFLVADPSSAVGVRCKLLDFGIAKLTAMGATSSVTKTGAVMGTPTYMSPEQCKGSGDVDARADLYALGCILYELVAGRPPFVCEGAGELLGSHLFVEPDPPSRHAPGLGGEAEALIVQLLAKQPARRVQSARELVARLGDLANAEPAAVVVSARTAAAPDERTQIAMMPMPPLAPVVPAAPIVPPARPMSAGVGDETARTQALDDPGEETQPVAMALPDDHVPATPRRSAEPMPQPQAIGRSTEPMPSPVLRAPTPQSGIRPMPSAVAPMPLPPMPTPMPLGPMPPMPTPMPAMPTPMPMGPVPTPMPMQVASGVHPMPGPPMPVGYIATPGPMPAYVPTPGPLPAYAATPPPMTAYVPTPTTLSGAAREAQAMAPAGKLRVGRIVLVLLLIGAIAGTAGFFVLGGGGGSEPARPAVAPAIDAAAAQPEPHGVVPAQTPTSGSAAGSASAAATGSASAAATGSGSASGSASAAAAGSAAAAAAAAAAGSAAAAGYGSASGSAHGKSSSKSTSKSSSHAPDGDLLEPKL